MTSTIPIHGTCEPRFESVRKVFQRGFESGPELGASVCFVLDGAPVVDLWGGHFDRERTREWQRDTLVNVYSTTKGMTALCAHQLVERGLLDLDAPVARYWPEFAAGGKAEIPVRWLLSHQAGLAAPRRDPGAPGAGPQFLPASMPRPITCAWISAAPSKMLRMRASASTRLTSYSRE